MSFRLWHMLAAFSLVFSQVGVTGCSSSSQQQQEEGLEVEEGSQQEAGNEATEQGNEASYQEGNEASYQEGSQEEMQQEGYYEGNAEGYQAAEENAGEASDEIVEEEQLVNDEGISQGEQQGDLQEIIEEMNQGEAYAANNTGVTESVMAENVPSNMSEPAGMDPVAVENIATGGEDMAAAPAPVAEAPMAEAAPAATPSVGAAPGLPEMGSKMSYIVQKGDTLAKIAAKIYGDGSKWREIADFTGLANPKLIYPGDVVYYQLTDTSMGFAQTYESLPRSEVQVQQGDTLSTIAGRVLGDSESWKLIWRQNDGIDDPDRLVVGSTIYFIQPGALSSALDSVKESIASAKVKLVKSIAENVDNNSNALNFDLNFESNFSNANYTVYGQI